MLFANFVVTFVSATMMAQPYPGFESNGHVDSLEPDQDLTDFCDVGKLNIQDDSSLSRLFRSEVQPLPSSISAHPCCHSPIPTTLHLLVIVFTCMQMFTMPMALQYLQRVDDKMASLCERVCPIGKPFVTS